MTALAPSRRLRRLRRWLALLALATAFLIAAACRFEAAARAVAALGAVACLVAWVIVLDLEGRLAERVEQRGSKRRPPVRGAASHRSPVRRTTRRKAA